MAGPLTGIASQATQGVQQKALEHAQPQKSGASKFDGVMADKAQGAGNVQATAKAQSVQQVDPAKQVDAAQKAQKAGLNKLRPEQQGQGMTARAVDPVQARAETSRVTGMLSKMVNDIEKGQGVMDKLINGGLSGKSFNSTELLALQAGMYKYTQELELTGKVVEKATSGLKDTLKTQV